ncbi:MAG: CHRD domain-containing protein [Rhodospirillales bacterium]
MLRSALFAAIAIVGPIGAASAAMVHFEASLDGKSEVPGNTTVGSGQVLATLDTATKTLKYTLTFQGLTGPATAAHFHGPAKAGANAGVAVAIGKDPAAVVSATATLSDAQIKELEMGMWYVNVHTDANKGGEIRGQMKRTMEGGGTMGMNHGAMPMKHDGMPMKH